MEIASRDFRPLSALGKDVTSPAERLAGFTSAALGLLVFSLVLFANLGPSSEPSAEEEGPKPTVIEASFVQLGREFAPNELPDRQVERSSLHQAPPVEIASPDARPKTETPEPVKEEEPEQQPPVDSYEDILDQLGNRAEYFDRLSRAEMEGSPDGVSEGNQREGDAYRGTLYALFRRGLVAPSTIPDDVLRGLRAEVEFTINELLRIRGLRLVSSSGNADFDRAIERRIAEINETDPLLPAPPEHQRAIFIGPPIRMIVTPPRSLGGGSPAPSEPRSEPKPPAPRAGVEAPVPSQAEEEESRPQDAPDAPQETPIPPSERPSETPSNANSDPEPRAPSSEAP